MTLPPDPPGFASIARIWSCMLWITPARLICRTSAVFSGVESAKRTKSPVVPAVLIAASNRPYVETAFSWSWVMLVEEVMSKGMKVASPPADLMVETMESPFWVLRPATIVFQPIEARSPAIPRPTGREEVS